MKLVYFGTILAITSITSVAFGLSVTVGVDVQSYRNQPQSSNIAQAWFFKNTTSDELTFHAFLKGARGPHYSIKVTPHGTQHWYAYTDNWNTKLYWSVTSLSDTGANQSSSGRFEIADMQGYGGSIKGISCKITKKQLSCNSVE